MYIRLMLRPENWTRPVGASPARVIAGAPGSRPRFVVERRRAKRGVKSLFGGSKRAGRSAIRHESCSLVRRTTGEPSRSCHGEGSIRWTGVPDMPPTWSFRGTGSGTYAAWFGTGEARLASLVSKDRSYKPMVKSSGGKRESDGVVVPLIAVSNAAGGKGPDFGHVGRGGKREGMAGTARPNYPEGRNLAPAKVRQLQNRLWAAAKQSKGRRFHAMYDRIYRSDVLWEAWERVRANRGAAGVDGLTLAAVEDYGVHRMLGELAADLRAGIYHPAPVRRVEIPKPDGRKRPLGIPTVRDRVCQQAAKIVLEPIFEADFLPCSFGFRPRRSATDALVIVHAISAPPASASLSRCS
jgi:hypothetical protein